MSANDADLTLHAGRVFCPSTGIDGAGAVAIRGDRTIASGPDVTAASAQSLKFPNGLLLPGLVDLHAHPAREGSKYGVDPDVEFLPRGTTTVLSQGDSGALDWPRYRESTIDACRTRVRLAINLSARGESMPGGCFENPADLDVDACVRAIEDGGEAIWGIATNSSRICCGDTDPREVVRLGLEAAERTGRPLLHGLREPGDWPFEDQLALLRPGDVITYCFRPPPVCLIEDGRVRHEFHAARDRGVLFDVGHGMASFDFDVAEAAIRDGFPPDTISTDSYRRHVGVSPPHSLPRTMSKLRAAGMPERDILTAVTARPARILGLEGEVGTLAPGACADVTVLEWKEDVGVLVDVSGGERAGGAWEVVLTVRGGELVR